MRAKVTRRPNGLYLMTRVNPVVCSVAGLGLDAYVTPGDELGLNTICEWGGAVLLHCAHLAPLETQEIDFCVQLRGEKYQLDE